MDLDEAIGGLCSIRRFKTDPVPEDAVREVIGLALRAPIPSREELWNVIAVYDRVAIAKMRAAVEERLEAMSRWSTQTRRRGSTAYDYFSAIFPEEVVRDRDPYAKMKAYSLFFDGAPVVLAVTIASLQRTRTRLARKKGFADKGGGGGMGGMVGGGMDRVPGVRYAFRQLLRAVRARLTRSMPMRRTPPPVLLEDHLGQARPDLQSVGAAIQNLALAAYARGYGVCWMTAPMLARDELEKILEVQQPWQLAALIPMGVPAETPKPRPRRAAAEVLTFRGSSSEAVPAEP